MPAPEFFSICPCLSGVGIPQSVDPISVVGFVQKPINELPNGGLIRLLPWSEIKGTVRGVFFPGTLRSVALRPSLASGTSLPRESPRVSLSYEALPDLEGGFAFLRVPPGEYELSVLLRSPPDERGQVRVLGTLNREIVVPEQVGEKSKGSVDIGVLRIEVEKRGNTAPITQVF